MSYTPETRVSLLAAAVSANSAVGSAMTFIDLQLGLDVLASLGTCC